MKRLLSGLALAGVLLAPAAQAADWTGAYAGLTGSFGTTGTAQYVPGSSFDLEGDEIFGGFAGYNMAYGSFVVGGEIAYSAGPVFQTGFPAYELTDFIDFKARVGATYGEALFYGVAGWSTATQDEGGGEQITMSGLNYGIGVDFLVTDNIFVGAEYLIRDLSGDSDVGTWSLDADPQSFQLRVGMKF